MRVCPGLIVVLVLLVVLAGTLAAYYWG
jgi:hypothetical protein